MQPIGSRFEPESDPHRVTAVEPRDALLRTTIRFTARTGVGLSTLGIIAALLTGGQTRPQSTPDGATAALIPEPHPST